jgi:RHS repeat-associated protein
MMSRGPDTFSYSTRGELLQANVAGKTVTYRYDVFGRRTARSVGGATTQYLYGDPDHGYRITHSRDPGGTLTTYLYDEADRLLAFHRSGARHYVVTDLLGSPRAVYAADGALERQIEYDSFGAVLSDSAPGIDLPVGFAGGLADSDTGLVRFGVRDYDPHAGRWTGRDPALYRGRQANLYAYVGNNPVSFVDRTGMGSLEVTGYAGVGLGIKLSIDPSGISVCGEAGFGLGGGVALDPFEAHDRSGLTAIAEASASAGPIGAGIKHELDDCGNLKTEAKVCAGPFCAKGDQDFLSRETGIGVEVGGENLKESVKDMFKATKVGAQAKVAGKMCLGADW